MLLRYVLTLLDDIFVDSAAKVGPMFTKKSLNDSEISLSSETILSLTRISLTGEDLLPLPVSEFISFQPALGSVALDASIFRLKVVRFRFTHHRIYLIPGRLIKYPVVVRAVFNSMFFYGNRRSFITFFISNESHGTDDCLTRICLIGAW